MRSIYKQKEINDLIIKMLKQYSDEVSSLAIKAIELSTEMSETDVIEVLESEIRDLIKDE